MDIDIITESLKSPHMLFILAGIILLVDLFIFENLQNLIRLHYKTIIFLIPFALIILGFQKMYSWEVNAALAFASVFLATLFYLLNKTQGDIAKEQSIESSNKYNHKNSQNIIDIFSTEGAKTAQFYIVPYSPEIYKDHIDHIFIKNENHGEHILAAIREMEQSNIMMRIIQDMMVDGISGTKRGFLKEMNSKILESAKIITILLKQYI